jgi:hypothetical protein
MVSAMSRPNGSHTIALAVAAGRRKRIADLVALGMTPPQIAQETGRTIHAVHADIRQIKILGVRLEIRDGRREPAAVKWGLSAGGEHSSVDCDETPVEARQRLARETAAGKRCGCGLLLPCIGDTRACSR